MIQTKCLIIRKWQETDAESLEIICDLLNDAVLSHWNNCIISPPYG